jgi:hypothetical protein
MQQAQMWTEDGDLAAAPGRRRAAGQRRGSGEAEVSRRPRRPRQALCRAGMAGQSAFDTIRQTYLSFRPTRGPGTRPKVDAATREDAWHQGLQRRDGAEQFRPHQPQVLERAMETKGESLPTPEPR